MPQTSKVQRDRRRKRDHARTLRNQRIKDRTVEKKVFKLDGKKMVQTGMKFHEH